MAILSKEDAAHPVLEKIFIEYLKSIGIEAIGEAETSIGTVVDLVIKRNINFLTNIEGQWEEEILDINPNIDCITVDFTATSDYSIIHAKLKKPYQSHNRFLVIVLYRQKDKGYVARANQYFKQKYPTENFEIMTLLGDSKAKKVFKEEIVKRFESKNISVMKFLLNEDFLNYLDINELQYLIDALDILIMKTNDIEKSRILQKIRCKIKDIYI
ncbi:MAG: hypothetical protein ACFFAQ_09085 [Promethearchaeota archaeon]